MPTTSLQAIANLSQTISQIQTSSKGINDFKVKSDGTVTELSGAHKFFRKIADHSRNKSYEGALKIETRNMATVSALERCLTAKTGDLSEQDRRINTQSIQRLDQSIKTLQSSVRAERAVADYRRAVEESSIPKETQAKVLNHFEMFSPDKARIADNFSTTTCRRLINADEIARLQTEFSQDIARGVLKQVGDTIHPERMSFEEASRAFDTLLAPIGLTPPQLDDSKNFLYAFITQGGILGDLCIKIQEGDNHTAGVEETIQARINVLLAPATSKFHVSCSEGHIHVDCNFAIEVSDMSAEDRLPTINQNYSIRISFDPHTVVTRDPAGIIGLNYELGDVQFQGRSIGQSLQDELITGRAVAGDAAAGDAVAGDAVAGDAVAGDAVAGDAVAGDAVAGDAVAGDAVAGDAVAGDAVAGDAVADDAAIRTVLHDDMADYMINTDASTTRPARHVTIPPIWTDATATDDTAADDAIVARDAVAGDTAIRAVLQDDMADYMINTDASTTRSARHVTISPLWTDATASDVGEGAVAADADAGERVV